MKRDIGVKPEGQRARSPAFPLSGFPVVTLLALCFMLFLLLCFCADSQSAVKRVASPLIERTAGSLSGIAELQKQISALEDQKAQLEAEKQKLVAKGDELSYKIEDLKIQAKSGLGIIGRYRLSRNLRKAQSLSEEIQTLEKKIQEIEAELELKTRELERGYEHQIAILLEELDRISQTEERRKMLEKVKEYQAAKEQLVKPPEEEELEYLDITKIEIKEYDSSQEIREKADLINDFANKLNNRINMFNARIGKLKEEFKTRKKLGEFAEEISFFGERISREEIAGDTGREPVEKSTEKTDEGPVMLERETFVRGVDAADIPTEQPPLVTATQPPTSPGRIVMERNGVSADFAGTSLNQIEEEIKSLEEQRQELKKELSTLSEKADSFYRKADEIEKSETKTGGKKR